MPGLLHTLLCAVSRRYRVAHCRHVDELPDAMSARLREECRELDPRSWSSVDDFMRDLVADCQSEEAPVHDGVDGASDIVRRSPAFA